MSASRTTLCWAVATVVVATAALSTARAPAAPTTAPAANAATAALIPQLDADDWRARDAAVAALVARGETVRPAVVDAAAPTTVTVAMADADARDVLAAVSRQTGVSIRTWLPGPGHPCGSPPALPGD